MSIQLPFVYGNGATASSLLGFAIKGAGAALATPRDSHSMILRQGPVTAINPTPEESAAIDAYAAHFATYYDEYSVDRHVTTLLRGGRQAYLDYEPDGLFLTSEAPPSSWPSHHAEVYSRMQFMRSRFLELCYGLGDNMYRAYAEMALACTQDFADGPAEPVFDFTGTTESVGAFLGLYESSSTQGSPLGNLGISLYPYQSSTALKPVVPANNFVREQLKLGYVCFCARWHLLGPGSNGTQPGDPWRMVVWRRKLNKPSRTAFITMSASIINMLATTINSKQEWKLSVIGQRAFIDSWALHGTGAAQRLVLAVSADTPSENRGASNGTYSMTSLLGMFRPGITYDSLPSVGSLFGAYSDFAAQSRTSWHFPASATTTSNSSQPGVTVQFPVNAASSLTTSLLADRPSRAGLQEWTGLTDSNVAVRVCQNLATRIPFASDLTTHPVINYRMRLDGLPAIEPLSPEMVPQELGRGLATRLSAADLRQILLAVETHSGDSTAALRGSLTTDERDFFGITDEALVAPPTNLLARTGVFQTASEAGQSINNEKLIEKDPDDADSVDVTFKQADSLAAKFRSHAIGNGRRGITVVGPTTRYTVPAENVYVATLEGRHVFTTPDFLTELTGEALSQVYASIRAGRRFIFAPVGGVNFTTTPEYLQYVSEFGDNGYPQIFDRYTMEVFGASYGSITSGAGVQGKVGDVTWSVHGQLEKGFLKDPDLWTPEFWLITCATKGWKLESVLGTLLTNPYGIGSLSQKVLAAASHEA